MINTNSKKLSFLPLFLITFIFVLGSLGLVSAVGTYPAVDPNMVLYYHFNNDSSVGESYFSSPTVYDYSNAKNNGTYYNGTYQPSSSFLNDGSIWFNSSNAGNDRIKVTKNDGLNNTLNFTICAWVKANSSGVIVAKSAGVGYNLAQFYFEVIAGSPLAVRIGWGDGVLYQTYNGVNFQKDSWTFVCANKTRVWTNGAGQSVSGPQTGATYNVVSNNDIYIGQTINNQAHLNGSIDDLFIYNRSLTDYEVGTIYNNYVGCINLTEDVNLGFNPLICKGTYYFNDTNSNGAISIGTSNTIIDLNGSTLIGNLTSNSRGIQVGNYNNIIIQNGNISNYNYGIITGTGTNITFINITFSNYNSGGIVTSSNSTFINSCSFTNSIGSGYGLYTNNKVDSILVNSSYFHNTRGMSFINNTNVNIINNYGDAEYMIFAVGSNGNNYRIINNNFYNNSNFLYFANQKNIYSSLNNYYNFTSVYDYWFLDSTNVTVYKDNFNTFDKGIDFDGVTNFNLSYSTLSNAIHNTDGWLCGVLIEHNSSGIIDNVNITNVDLYGIFLRTNQKNVIISNSFIDVSSNQNKINNGRTSLYFNPSIAIAMEQTYDGFPAHDFASTDTYLNLTGDIVTNVNVSNITFGSNVQILMSLRGAFNITYDNSISNFWYRSITGPKYIYIYPKEYFISKNYNNVSIAYNLAISYLLGEHYGLGQQWNFRYKLFKDYTYMLNTNLTQSYDYSVNNLTSTLLTNGTSLCNGSSSNLAQNTGQINITIPPNGDCYVFDNANVTEGVSIANFPLSINTQGNSKHITSSLDQAVSILIITDLGDCDTKNYVSYTTDSGIKTEWKGSEATKVCNYLKNGYILSIEPATNSNIITWTDGTSSLQRNILQILIVLLGLIVVIVVISFTYVYARDNFDEIKLDEFVKYGITVLLVLILVIALILYIVTIL